MGPPRLGRIMNWGSASDFFAMGGYGLFVWGSFAMCALAIVAELIALSARRRALEKDEPQDDAVPDWKRSSHET
jgi:heme exporter protein D